MGRVRRAMGALLDAQGAERELSRLRAVVRVQEREIARLRERVDQLQREQGQARETGTPYFRNAPVAEAKGLVVDEAECIGCGTCEAICPEAFVMVDRVARVVEGGDEVEGVDEAIGACPVQCIRRS